MSLGALLDKLETGWPDKLPDHLSASQMTMFQRCPEQFRRRYVLGHRERPAAAMVWGSADHYAHEQNFTQKIHSGEDITEADVKVAFAEGFDRAIDRAGGDVDWGDEKPGDLKDKGVELVGVYHRQVSPSIQPTAVEAKFSVQVPGVPVPVIGFVDVETEPVAIERKTAKAKVSEAKPDWLIAGLLYQAVTEKPVDWHVSVKTKTPAVYTPVDAGKLRLEFHAAAVGRAERIVKSVARTLAAYYAEFGPDEPWTGAITHPWACGFCGFKPTCYWWTTSASDFGDEVPF
jgi:hypothetical protein